MTIEESPPGTATPPVRRRRSRIALWVGVGLIGSGLAILGWLAWQFWGTNWVSHRTQARVIATLHEDWAHGKTVTRVSVGDDQPVRALAIIRIPRFGSDYAVPVLQGTSKVFIEPDGSPRSHASVSRVASMWQDAQDSLPSREVRCES